jgi:N-acetylmuramoyl-L-alanine amidase
VAYADKLQLVIGLNDGYEYYTSQNGNQTTLLFLSPGASGQQNGASGSAGNSGSSGVVDKSGYEIAIPKPAGLTKAMVTDEDNYFSNNFVIRLNGDYTSQISSANISNSSSTVSGITVSLNSSNQTEICFRTTKLQGYEYVMDDTGIYVNVGNPKDIYKNIVVLDPGHGGGAVGAQYFGTDEKDLNYKILYTIGKKYFNQDTSKLKVYYTRITDVDMSLSDRAAFASRYGADVFVSLHMNASLTRSVYGTEVYYSSSNTGTTASGLTSDVMADFFADRVTSAIGSDNRGSRSERYTVVYKNTVPAILIELGFLSNASDYAKLSDSAYQETAAKAIYDTVLQLFAQYPTGR